MKRECETLCRGGLQSLRAPFCSIYMRSGPLRNGDECYLLGKDSEGWDTRNSDVTVRHALVAITSLILLEACTETTRA